MRNVEVRKDRQGQGVGTALYDAIEQHFGVRLVPSGFLKEGGFKFWSKRNPDAVKHYQYVSHQDTYMSPNQIVGHYKLTKRALMFAADDLDRNNLKTAVRELKGAIDAIDWAEVSDQRLRSEFALPRVGEAPSGIEIGKYGFTPEAQARIALIRERVQAVFDRLPPAVKGNLIDSLTYGGKDVDGTFNPTDAMVWVSLRAQDPERVAMHEEIHVLRKLKVLTDDEYNVLVEHTIQAGHRKSYDVDKRYKKIYERKLGKGARLEQALVEETVAEMAADYKTGTRFSPAIDRILAKIIDVLDQVFRAVSGLGFRQVTDVFRPVLSVEQVMQRIRSGEVGRRPADLSGLGRRDGTGQILQQDRATGQAMRRQLDSLGFYSKLDEVLGTFGPKDKVTTATLAQRGVKAAELEARGLGQMLADGKAVPVADLRAAAEQNKVQLKETQRGNSDVLFKQLKAVFVADGHKEHEAHRFARMVFEGEHKAEELSFNPEAKRIADQFLPPSKWQAYSLDPSNPTYRETVIHLPSEADQLLNRRADLMVAAERGEITEAEYYRQADPITKRLDTRPDDFQSGHFPEPNIIGHMMTSMTFYHPKRREILALHSELQGLSRADLKTRGPEIQARIAELEGQNQRGNVYTIDQIQSDWGQKLRDGGVKDEAKIAAAEKAMQDAEQKLRDTWAAGIAYANERGYHLGRLESETNPLLRQNRFDLAERVKNAGSPELKKEILAASDDYAMKVAEYNTATAATPGNPLVNTTDQWVTTTLRRAITQAVEANADYIAIPSGDTVLGYNPGDRNGMNEFYGKIVPKNLAKILGTKGEQIATLDSPSGKTGLGKGFTLFPLTDEMKAKVQAEGMPMFSFAGEKSVGADTAKLAQAKQMITDGASREDAWRDTGWFQGVDGRWRYEITDRAWIAENEDGTYRETGMRLLANDALGDLLDGKVDDVPLAAIVKHEDLFAAYPEMAQYSVMRDETRLASYGSSVFTMGKDFLRQRMNPVKTEDITKPTRVMLHEVQHAIQDFEEFARGGSPGEFTKELLDMERARMLSKSGDSTGWTSVGTTSGDMPDHQVALLLYRRLAGEVESRAVESRMRMTAEERRRIPPWKSYDVPEDLQIVRRNGERVTSLMDDGTLASGLKETDRLGTEADLISVCRR